MSERIITTQDISNLVRHLGVTLSNVETFSVDHQIAKKQIAAAHEYLAGLLRLHNKPLVITVADKRIVFDQTPLEDRNPVAAKFAARLEENHVNHLTFDLGLTVAEMEGFYRVFGRGSKFVNTEGGLPALLAAAQVTHIKVRRMDFVVVGEDEKIVSKGAVVVESQKGEEHTADAPVIQQVLQKVVERIDEQEWLLHELKNNPKRAADLFVESINLVASRMETGMTAQSAGSEALLKSIKILGDVLVAGEDNTPPKDMEDLEKFIIILEKEVHQCSTRLISSKVAAGLLMEILEAVTSYADQARAHKIAEGFLHGEKGVKKVGRLLRDVIPPSESAKDFISRIRKYLLQRGLTETDLAQLEETIKTECKPKPCSKPRKWSNETVAIAIAERLKDLNIEPALLEEIVARLCRFIEDRAREKAGELHSGVVLWDANGKVEFISHDAAQTFGSETGFSLSAALKTRLCELSFPLTTPAPLLIALSVVETQLLQSVSLVLKNKAGDVCGVLLNVGSSGSKRP